ncbi:MAG: hypothetical protein QOJ91_133 [Sphingomonadales bacterium]|nr:hypothetical protein [Sphingomonadales bacterium]
MAALTLAVLAHAEQERVAPGITSAFECEMVRGNFFAVGSKRVSEKDRRYLPEHWTLEIGRPGQHDRSTRYDDPILGKPIDVTVLWGYRNASFDGSGKLVQSEFDWWSLFYTLDLTNFGEAMIWIEYFRTVPGTPRAQMRVFHGYGKCHEMVSVPVRKPS